MTRAARNKAGQYILAAALVFHLGLIAAVSLRELSWLVANDLTVLSSRWHIRAQTIHRFTLNALGEELPPANVFHSAVAAYLNLAGIQGGYGFFAPNISDSYRLSFEFQFPDGHIENDLPRVASEEAALRLASFLDEIERTPVDALREALIKLLAIETWSEHGDAISVRAVFSSVTPVSDTEPTKESARNVLFTYEFTLKAD